MLRKIDVRYDPVADRLILQAEAETPDGLRHHGVQLTRRTWGATREALYLHFVATPATPAATPAPDQSAPPPNPAAPQPADDKPTVAPAPASPPAPAGTVFPVATGMQCARRRTDGLWLLTFPCDGSRSITLVLTDPTLRALAQALLQQEARAAWNLPPLVPPDPAAPKPTGTSMH